MGVYGCDSIHTKDGLLLAVFELGVRPQHSTEIEVVNLSIVDIAEVAPLLLAGLALHIIFVDSSSQIEIRELLLEVLVNIIIHLGESKLGAGDILEQRPVCHHLLHS